MLDKFVKAQSVDRSDTVIRFQFLLLYRVPAIENMPSF